MSLHTEGNDSGRITDEMLEERVAASDRDRKKWRGSRGWIQTVIGAALLLSAFAVAFFGFSRSPIICLLAGGVLFAIGGLLVAKAPQPPDTVLDMRTFRQMLAQGLIPSVLESVFDRVDDYDADGCLAEDDIRKTGLKSWDRLSGSDWISAVYRGRPIKLSDVRLEKVDGNSDDKDTRYITVFQGICLECDTGKPLTEDMEISLWDDRWFRDKRVVDMESEAFNRRFCVRCADRHLAFYLLTPTFQEKLMSITQGSGGPFELRFMKDGTIRAAIHTGHDTLFHVSSLHEPPASLRERFTRELKDVTGLLEELCFR